MAKKSDSTGGGTPGVGNGHDKERRVQVGIRLVPGEPSTQPLFSNFSGVTNAGGLLLLEFGFLEPAGLNAIARSARSGANPPNTIKGQRVCRLALPPDTATQLARQLKGLLVNAAKARAKQHKAGSA